MNKPHLRYKKQTPRERTWTIHFIAIEKAVKGTLLLLVAFKMLTLFNRDVHGWAEDFVTRHGIDIANRYVQSTLERLSGVGNTQLVEMSIGATVYAALLFTEGIGLWLQKRWAEYMTAFLTALFIPVELYEIYERFTWIRVAILALNIFVVWYLSTRLKDEKKEVRASASGKIETRVKICGITNLSDAQNAVDNGADAIGFNFYPASKRYILPREAAAIGEIIVMRVEKVGVFVNASVEEIIEIEDVAQLDVIQLHGDESPEFIEQLRLESDATLIKAVRTGPDFEPKDVLKYRADAILIDAFSEDERGGTGKTVDWTIAKRVTELVDTVYLAGGLSPENVADAITAVKPYAVDVASGVEASPGKKDHEKVAAFIKAAKEVL
ncbi:hypothetical protein BH10ACI2_BH10ACI2_16560 [soil metagenome]